MRWLVKWTSSFLYAVACFGWFLDLPTRNLVLGLASYLLLTLFVDPVEKKGEK
jgi:hypothetical protein